jgi:hypothetical protein
MWTSYNIQTFGLTQITTQPGTSYWQVIATTNYSATITATLKGFVVAILNNADLVQPGFSTSYPTGSITPYVSGFGGGGGGPPMV